MKIGNKLWNIIEIIVRAVFGLIFKILKVDATEEVWDSLLQFVRFGLVGVWNTAFSYAINMGSLFLFSKLGILSAHNLDMYAANTIAFVISVFVSFLLNSKFVFSLEEGQERNFWKALFKSYLSYGFTGLILTNVLAYVWVDLLGISKLIAPLISLVISIPINFILNKLWAFKTDEKKK